MTAVTQRETTKQVDFGLSLIISTMATTARQRRSYSSSLRTDDGNGLEIIHETQKIECLNNADFQLDCPAYLNQEPSFARPLSRNSCSPGTTNKNNGRKRTSALSDEARSLLRKSLLSANCSTHATTPHKGGLTKSTHTREGAEARRTRNEESGNSSIEAVTPSVDSFTASARTSIQAGEEHDPEVKSHDLDGIRKHIPGQAVVYPPKEVLELENTAGESAGNELLMSDRVGSSKEGANASKNDSEAQEQQEATTGHKIDELIKSSDDPCLRSPPQSLRTQRRICCNPAVTSATSIRHHGKTGRLSGRTHVSSTESKSTRYKDKLGPRCKVKVGTAVAASQTKLSPIASHLARAKCGSALTPATSTSEQIIPSNAGEAKVRTLCGTESPRSRNGRDRISRSFSRAHSRRCVKQTLSTVVNDSEDTKGLQSLSIGSHIGKLSVEKSRNAASITAQAGLMW